MSENYVVNKKVMSNVPGLSVIGKNQQGGRNGVYQIRVHTYKSTIEKERLVKAQSVNWHPRF